MITNNTYIIMMMGYTAVGKSTLAKKLSTKLNCDIFHSAVTRKKLGLTPNKEDAKHFFFLDNPERNKVDKIIYSENLNYASKSIQNVKCYPGCGYFHKWQRMQVYDFVEKSNSEVFIVRVLFDNKKVIKDRLNKRMDDFEKSPLNETPGWDTYIDSLKLTELPYNDESPNGLKPTIIEFDYNKKNVFLFSQNDKNKLTKKIFKTLTQIMETEKRKF